MQNILAKEDMSGFLYWDLKKANVRRSAVFTFVFMSALHRTGGCLGRRKENLTLVIS